MVKDIVVNLSVREDGGNVGDYAVSVADALGAHIAGIKNENEIGDLWAYVSQFNADGSTKKK